ncbi:MAG: bifunctional phosphoglucose/phosphomannose isomerase [Thermoleophilia bacterium]
MKLDAELERKVTRGGARSAVVGEAKTSSGGGARRRALAEGLTPGLVARLDRADLLALIRGLGAQMVEGWRLGSEALIDVGTASSATAAAGGPRAVGTRPDGVVVCGMGGSAIGADILRSCLPEWPLPYEVVRGYALPAWAGPRTLVVACSYSGNTEETLSCLATALDRGSRVVCVTSGGMLAAVAHEHGLPLVVVPGELQPRAALGYLAMSLAAALTSTGLVANFAAQVHEAGDLLGTMAAELDPAVPAAANAAKALAARLHGRLTVVYGAGLTAPAARRWKGQINENAKALAFFAELPELDHNELMGWTSQPELSAQTAAVLLVDPAADERLRRRFEFTAEYLREHLATVEVVTAGGESRLARLASTNYLGDWVSYYLALLYAVDPTPVVAIEAFKQRLADTPTRPSSD